MGGSVEEARRYVDRMKKQTERENQAKRESDRLISKNWYQANKESRKKGFAAYHEANKESQQKTSVDGWRVAGGTGQIGLLEATFPEYHISTAWAKRMRGPQRMR